MTLDTRVLDRLEPQVPGRVNQALKKVSFDWVRVARASMGAGVSSPGDPPGVDTGALKNSLDAESIGPMTWRLHDGKKYGAPLEYGTAKMAARPWFEPALRQVAESLPDELKAAVRGG